MPDRPRIDHGQPRKAEGKATGKAKEKIRAQKVEDTVHWFLLLSPVRRQEQLRYSATKGFKQRSR